MCGGAAWVDEMTGRLPLDVAHDLALAARRAARSAGGDADAPLLREASELSVFPGVPLS